MKKFSFIVTILVLLVVLLTACQAQEPVPAGEEPGQVTVEEKTGPFRVAVVMPSAINDLAFSQSMFDALTVIQEEMGGGVDLKKDIWYIPPMESDICPAN